MIYYLKRVSNFEKGQHAPETNVISYIYSKGKNLFCKQQCHLGKYGQRKMQSWAKMSFLVSHFNFLCITCKFYLSTEIVYTSVGILWFGEEVEVLNIYGTIGDIILFYLFCVLIQTSKNCSHRNINPSRIQLSRRQ